MYSLVASALEEELYASSSTIYDRSSRSGVIHEWTALGLLTRAQNANAAPLPSLPIEDEVDKINLFYIAQTREGTVWYPRQVKASARQISSDDDNYAMMITGEALGNAPHSFWGNPRPYQTAHAIVNEINGQATDYQTYTLDDITTSLIHAVIEERPFVASYMDLAVWKTASGHSIL
jgi:hypothetical protein